MQIPDPLGYMVLASALGIQGWIVREIIDIKTKLAGVTATQDNMTKKIKAIAIGLLILSPALFFGCSTANNPLSSVENTVSKALTKTLLLPVEVTGLATNLVQVPVIQTNQEVKSVTGPGLVEPYFVTNTVIITNFTEQVRVVPVTNVIYQPAPSVTGAITLAQGATPFIPPPYSEAAAAGLAGLSALLGLYAAKKTADSKAANGDAQAAQSQADLTQQMLTATIKGVEAVTEKIPEAKQVKASIQKYAEAAGVQDTLHKAVQAATTLLLLCFLTLTISAQTPPLPTVTATVKSLIVWDANTETNLAGYNAYIWSTNGYATNFSVAKPNTQVAVTNLVDIVQSLPDAVYHVYLTAFNDSLIESDPSNEVQFWWFGHKLTKPVYKGLTFTR